VNSVEGHWDGCCEIRGGPCHHNDDDDSIVGCMPLEIRSAGLDKVGTCLQIAEDVLSCIRATLFPTNVFHLVGKPFIHVRTMDESVHKYDSLMIDPIALRTFWYKVDSNVAAHNSNLGIVTLFNGATLDVAHNSQQDMLRAGSIERM
jgi:hypothetical protein